MHFLLLVYLTFVNGLGSGTFLRPLVNQMYSQQFQSAQLSLISDVQVSTVKDPGAEQMLCNAFWGNFTFECQKYSTALVCMYVWHGALGAPAPPSVLSLMTYILLSR